MVCALSALISGDSIADHVDVGWCKGEEKRGSRGFGKIPKKLGSGIFRRLCPLHVKDDLLTPLDPAILKVYFALAEWLVIRKQGNSKFNERQ